MEKPLLQVRMQARYGQQSILREVQFDLQAGDALGLVGSSGSGKSTLVLALLGLLSWRGGQAAGEVLIDGKNLLGMRERDARQLRGRRIALVPQSPMTALNAAVSLRSHFEEAWKAHQQSGKRGLDERLKDLLPEVQLPSDGSFLSRRPGGISVGQAQRVLIALALLHHPAILIADEPTSALDPVTQAEILKLLRHLNRKAGTTLLYISHDLLSVLQLCTRVAVLDSGMIVECLPVENIGEARHSATLSLLRALPMPPQVFLEYREMHLS